MSSNHISYAFDISDLDILKRKMLQWANQSNIFLFLDNNGYTHTYGRYECLCGKDAVQVYDADALLSGALPEGRWLLGHLSYDLKNAFESNLVSRHPEKYTFGTAGLFEPAALAYIERGQSELHLYAPDAEASLAELLNTPLPDSDTSFPKVSWIQDYGREKYIAIVEQLREHIRNGDCYEINFCNGATAADPVSLNPLALFEQLNKTAPNPFAALYRKGDQYTICASPERFLMKQGKDLIAQPIKGTIRRGSNPEEDSILQEQLSGSIKERAENVMITDLMRNDLARVCATGSITVEELFGLYAFPKVHQMISTIRGSLRNDISFADIIRNTFPMGSMTGAPKIMVMQLIDLYEHSRRELFSGCVGYITPDGDFDLNVIIRSLFYRSDTGLLSYHTGGAITFDSDPAAEWEETQLKASAIRSVFNT